MRTTTHNKLQESSLASSSESLIKNDFALQQQNNKDFIAVLKAF